MRFVQAGVMLLGAALYVAISIIGSSDYEDLEAFQLGVLWTIAGWNVLVLVVTILVLIDSVRKMRAGRTRELAVGALIVKLAAIPFFLFTFAVLVVLTLAGFIFFLFGGTLLHIGVGIGIGLSYLAMVSTSIYGFATIVQLRRERRIDTVLTVLYAILLLVFVSDTVAGILLFAHSRRRQATMPLPPSPHSGSIPGGEISQGVG